LSIQRETSAHAHVGIGEATRHRRLGRRVKHAQLAGSRRAPFFVLPN
jgi:hypothetical protein